MAARSRLASRTAERLAVWVLNTQVTLPQLQKLEFICVPGSDNANFVAQLGLFTLLGQQYSRASMFEGPESLCEYISTSGNASLESPIGDR